MRVSTLHLLLAILISCSGATETYEPELSQVVKGRITNEVNGIINASQLGDYLREIQSIDQGTREKTTQMSIDFGSDSEEMRLAILAQVQLDLENLAKVELILMKFGYPGSAVVGRNTSDIPLMVIHHSQTYEIRVKHFETLYTAYLDGQINENLFSTYLERMYQMKFEERFDMPEGKPFRLEQEVDTLIQILSLR